MFEDCRTHENSIQTKICLSLWSIAYYVESIGKIMKKKIDLPKVDYIYVNNLSLNEIIDEFTIETPKKNMM